MSLLRKSHYKNTSNFVWIEISEPRPVPRFRPLSIAVGPTKFIAYLCNIISLVDGIVSNIQKTRFRLVKTQWCWIYLRRTKDKLYVRRGGQTLNSILKRNVSRTIWSDGTVYYIRGKNVVSRHDWKIKIYHVVYYIF